MYLYCYLYILVSVLIDCDPYKTENEIIFCYLPSIANFSRSQLVDLRTRHTDPLDAIHISARWAVYPSAGGIGPMELFDTSATHLHFPGVYEWPLRLTCLGIQQI